MGAEPLTDKEAFSESTPLPEEPTAVLQPVQPQQPIGLAAPQMPPHGLEPRSTGYESLAEMLTKTLSRLSDPTILSREIYAQASKAISSFTQAPSCATCKASTLDSTLNQLTCRNHSVLVLSNYICGSHQVFAEAEPAQATAVDVVAETPEVEPVVEPSNKELFSQAEETAKRRTDLSTEDQEIYAIVLYKKMFKEKEGSLEGAFATQSDFSDGYKTRAKEKMTQYKAKKKKAI